MKNKSIVEEIENNAGYKTTINGVKITEYLVTTIDEETLARAKLEAHETSNAINRALTSSEKSLS